MLEEKITQLKSEIIEFSNLVLDMFKNSVSSFLSKNTDNLKKIIEEQELKANEYEFNIEESCIYISAQYEPKAYDLRFIFCVIKMNSDLERIADHTVNIAQSGLYLIQNSTSLVGNYKNDIEYLFKLANNMLLGSITSFIEEEPSKAKILCSLDQEVDKYKNKIYRKIIEDIKSTPSNVESYLHLERIINNIERVADLSTNICEDIIFLYEARIIKHHKDEHL